MVSVERVDARHPQGCHRQPGLFVDIADQRCGGVLTKVEAARQGPAADVFGYVLRESAQQDALLLQHESVSGYAGDLSFDSGQGSFL